MRFLVVGSGGREHALVRALKYSPSISEVHAMPGNAGMAQEAICHQMKINDFSAWEAFLKKYTFDCVVVGPEVPLADGLADFLRTKGVPVVGPSQAAARLESSKVFSKEFMVNAGVPTARFEIVESKEELLEKSKTFKPPYVLKADGLAAGKGVFICKTMKDLEDAAQSIFVDKTFGDAGRRAIIEEFQPGFELSYLVLTNGKEFQPLPISQDHKRLLDGDEGPNTGGMGVIGPVTVDASLRERIHNEIVIPSLRHLDGLGMLYRGILYFGVMVTESGPNLLEYNVRFGDPEAQVILPLLSGDWGQVFVKLANGELDPLSWKPLYMACVVMAAPGYPEHPQAGVAIEGEIQAQSASSYFLHAGTQFEQGKWSTKGGRVLNSCGMGSSIKEAIANSYAQSDRVHWQGMQIRKDIGAKQV